MVSSGELDLSEGTWAWRSWLGVEGAWAWRALAFEESRECEAMLCDRQGSESE
jgi:hypothetical protein